MQLRRGDMKLCLSGLPDLQWLLVHVASLHEARQSSGRPAGVLR
jgi:hypothetical protein